MAGELNLTIVGNATAKPELHLARPSGPAITHDTTTTTVTHTDPCPGCDEGGGIRWVDSTPDTDTWACRQCGAEWTITVDVPGVS